MTTEEAWQIVYDIAKQNVLTVAEGGPAFLKKEAKRQQTALNVVHEFIVNNMEE